MVFGAEATVPRHLLPRRGTQFLFAATACTLPANGRRQLNAHTDSSCSCKPSGRFALWQAGKVCFSWWRHRWTCPYPGMADRQWQLTWKFQKATNTGPEWGLQVPVDRYLPAGN